MLSAIESRVRQHTGLIYRSDVQALIDTTRNALEEAESASNREAAVVEQLDRITAELVKAKADAERMDWLASGDRRIYCKYTHTPEGTTEEWCVEQNFAPTLREAIDAAREANKAALCAESPAVIQHDNKAEAA